MQHLLDRSIAADSSSIDPAWVTAGVIKTKWRRAMLEMGNLFGSGQGEACKVSGGRSQKRARTGQSGMSAGWLGWPSFGF